jgi:hypothetical protein
MNINERLELIETKNNHLIDSADVVGNGAVNIQAIYNDILFLLSTIKQLQEESQNRFESILHGDEENLILQQHIAELEKERREITMAHEAFLRDLENAIVIMKVHNKVSCLTLEEVEQSYNKHFHEPIHLAEQVRKAKLSAGVEE